MAIEIISRNHPTATKTVVCKNCGCELRYTKADTFEETHTDYTGCKDTYRYLTCPNCSCVINVGY